MGDATQKIEAPNKHYFKIGEASRLLGVKPHVLRYWEQEFKSLKPEKSKTNHRIYSRKDVETLFLIKRLLYEERYTIEGARSRIRELVSYESNAKQVEGKQLSLLENNATTDRNFLEEFEQLKKDLKEANDRLSELKEEMMIQKRSAEEREVTFKENLARMRTVVHEIMKICE